MLNYILSKPCHNSYSIVLDLISTNLFSNRIRFWKNPERPGAIHIAPLTSTPIKMRLNTAPLKSSICQRLGAARKLAGANTGRR